MSDGTSFDERRLSRLVATWLPIVTAVAGWSAVVLVGPATGILVFAAGVMLGVIALLWSSLRVLSGDAPLPPELEAIDASARGIDALSSRKKMLLRALKDLDNERALGKIDEDDHADVARTYREELKDVMRRIDESLAPHRAKAEEIANAYLQKVGAVAKTDAEAAPAPEEAPSAEEKAAPAAPERRACPKCEVSNEPDAKFCKGCGAAISEDAHEA